MNLVLAIFLIMAAFAGGVILGMYASSASGEGICRKSAI